MNADKYAELFATESREHLAQMSRALVALEAMPGDRESLDAIFRSVHTIKGMAAAMGYDVAADLGHSIESVLEAIRSGERSIDSSLVDLLLSGSDALEAAVDAAVAGADPPDVTKLIERLEEAREEGGRGSRGGRGGRGGSSEEGESARAGGAPHAAGEGPSDAGSKARASRVSVEIRKLDNLMNLIGELMIVRSQLDALAAELQSESLQDAVERAGALITEMQSQVVESRMVPVWRIFDRFPRVVRDVARSLGKEVEIVISGKQLELDRSMLDAISDPLVHLLRNAVDHGIENPKERKKAGKPRVGRIELSARRERSRIVIVVKDDGRGVDRERVIAQAEKLGLLAPEAEPSDNELFRILARPGFSTAGRVTKVSGRGVGLNVVEDFVRGFGGSVRFTTEPGRGSTTLLELPLTVAMVRALIVEVTGQLYALPVTFTRASFEGGEDGVEVAHGREWVRWRDERLPLTRLQRLFGDESNGGRRRNASVGGGGRGGSLNLVALEFAGERMVVCVDRFVGEEEIVVKSFDPPLGALSIFSGATVRADGRPALIVDVTSLSLRPVQKLSSSGIVG
ncbi:MAG: chemotaxis protein CheA [Gemmatimonadota bacterium]